MTPQEPDIESLIEEAVVDCYDEYECRNAFSQMIDDKLSFPFEATISGKKITVEKVDGNDRIIKAYCRIDQFLIPVDVLDLEVEKDVPGSEWIFAYREWEEGGYK